MELSFSRTGRHTKVWSKLEAQLCSYGKGPHLLAASNGEDGIDTRRGIRVELDII